MRARSILTCFFLLLLLGMPALVSVVSAAAVDLKLKDGRTIRLYENSYALVVGSKDYTAWPDLPGVGEDVVAVKVALERHGFRVETLLNPTREAFESTVLDFISNYGQAEDNRLLFYFAGHGYTLTTQWGRELGYIVPTDAPLPSADTGAFKRKAISMLKMEVYAKQIEAKHALFLFDSCFSGSLFEITRAVPASISVKTARPVRQFITAGTAEQEVPDVSIFRRQFVSGLNGEADLNTDGFITGSEFAQFLEDTVTNYSRRAQTPQYGKIRDPILDQGDFVFVAPKAPSIQISASAKSGDDPAFELAYWDSIKDSKDPAFFQAYLRDYPSGRFTQLAKLNIKRWGAAKAPSKRLSEPVGGAAAKGSKWTKQAIKDFKSVAGAWKGTGKASTWSFPVRLTIMVDGSYEKFSGGNHSNGTMRIVDGNIQYAGYIVTLYERDGQRRLKAQAGNIAWQARPANK